MRNSAVDWRDEPPSPIFALVTRGLEGVASREMESLLGLHVQAAAYRRLACTYSGDLSALLGLRTVDDVFITLAEWTGIGHERRFLSEFSDWSQSLPIANVLPVLAQWRSLRQPPVFSVTANFVGKRNYSVPQIKTAIAEGVSRQVPAWQYTADDGEADLNIRVFIEHQQALVGLRVGQAPLYRRAYKQAHIPGSLKPTVAAAMVHLAGVQPGDVMVDPFCGGGTILIEAEITGAKIIGGDLDADVLDSAVNNRQAAAIPASVLCWDTRSLPLKSAAVDRVITNMPWGRQVQVDEGLKNFYRQSLAEMQRVVRPSGIIVILTTYPELLAESPASATEISLFGQNPHILTYPVR